MQVVKITRSLTVWAKTVKSSKQTVTKQSVDVVEFSYRIATSTLTKDQTMSEAEIASISEKDAMPADAFVEKRDALLLEWEQSKVELETAKTKEMELRKKFVAFAFDSNKKSGTERVELNNGYEAKAVKKLNYNVNQEKINESLDAIENIGGPEGELIAKRLIKWTAELSLTEYNQLDSKYKVIIDKAITTSEGAPSLEIIAPKNSRKL